MYKEAGVYKKYIQLGTAGGFNLLLRNYDNVYKMTFTACCYNQK